MVLTSDGYLGSDIRPEITDQAEDIKNIMRTIWAEETYCWQKVSRTKTYLSSPSNKKARHVNQLNSCYMTIELLNWHRF